MKVLIISERWWPDGTGGVLASHLIAKVLRDAGFRLTVVHGTREPVKLNGIRYVYSSLLGVRDKQRLWLNCLILARERWFLKLVSSSDVVYIPRYCYPLVPVAKKFSKRAVVHLHDYQPVSYNAVVLRNSGRIIPKGFRDAVKLELLEHGSILRALGAVSAPLNSFCRLWLKEVDAIICVSKRQAEIIGKIAPELASKIKIIYNPLPEIPLIEKKFKEPTFLYLGGDSYFKGFHIFLKASQKILKRSPFAKFLLTGIFKRKDSRYIINALNNKFSSAFHILGFISYNEVLKLHSRSYALLFPSIWEEPLPYAIIESMLAGTVPIASKVGGVIEVLHGTKAEDFLFTPSDVDELVSKVEVLSSFSSEQLIELGHDIRNSILRRFTYKHFEQEFLNALT